MSIEFGGEVPAEALVTAGDGIRGFDTAFDEEEASGDLGTAEVGVEFVDSGQFGGGDGAGDEQAVTSLEIEIFESEDVGEAFGDGEQAIEGGVLEGGLFLEYAQAFAEDDSVGEGWGELGDFGSESVGLVLMELDADPIGEDAEHVAGDEDSEAVHPEAIDELLAIAKGVVFGEEVSGGLITADAAGGEFGELVRGGGGADGAGL